MAAKKNIKEIEKIIYGGYGISRAAGKIWMIKGVIDKEIVEIRELREKKGIILARPRNVLKESVYRVKPACRYFLECGGCAFQHIEYPRQLAVKKYNLKELLRQDRDIENGLIKDVAPSPQIYFYRLKANFKILDKKIGFFKSASNEIIEIDHCWIVNENINLVLPALKELAAKYSYINEIAVFYSPSEKETILEFKTLKKINQTKAFERLVGKKRIVGVILTQNNKVYKRKGKDSTFIKAGDLTFRVNIGAFWQTNFSLIERFYTAVENYISPGEACLDLYCGAGFFTLFLSRFFKKVWGVESNFISWRNAEYNKRRNNVENVNFINSEVENIDLQNITGKERINLVLLDPPRTGLDKKTIKALSVLAPKDIIYVSCNPATLSRDIRSLTQDYLLREVKPLDNFPQTYHIESISWLRHRKIK